MSLRHSPSVPGLGGGSRALAGGRIGEGGRHPASGRRGPADYGSQAWATPSGSAERRVFEDGRASAGPASRGEPAGGNHRYPGMSQSVRSYGSSGRGGFQSTGGTRPRPDGQPTHRYENNSGGRSHGRRLRRGGEDAYGSGGSHGEAVRSIGGIGMEASSQDGAGLSAPAMGRRSSAEPGRRARGDPAGSGGQYHTRKLRGFDHGRAPPGGDGPGGDGDRRGPQLPAGRMDSDSGSARSGRESARSAVGIGMGASPGGVFPSPGLGSGSPGPGRYPGHSQRGHGGPGGPSRLNPVRGAPGSSGGFRDGGPGGGRPRPPSASNGVAGLEGYASRHDSPGLVHRRLGSASRPARGAGPTEPHDGLGMGMGSSSRSVGSRYGRLAAEAGGPGSDPGGPLGGIRRPGSSSGGLPSDHAYTPAGFSDAPRMPPGGPEESLSHRYRRTSGGSAGLTPVLTPGGGYTPHGGPRKLRPLGSLHDVKEGLRDGKQQADDPVPGRHGHRSQAGQSMAGRQRPPQSTTGADGKRRSGGAFAPPAQDPMSNSFGGRPSAVEDPRFVAGPRPGLHGSHRGSRSSSPSGVPGVPGVAGVRPPAPSRASPIQSAQEKLHRVAPMVKAVSAFNDASRRSRTRPGSLLPGGPGTPSGNTPSGQRPFGGRGQQIMGRSGSVRTGAGDRRSSMEPSPSGAGQVGRPFDGMDSIRSRRGGRNLSIAPRAPATPLADAIRREKNFNDGDEAADAIIDAVGSEGIGPQMGAPAARREQIARLVSHESAGRPPRPAVEDEMPMGAQSGLYGEGAQVVRGSGNVESAAAMPRGGREQEALVDAAEDVFGRAVTSMMMEEDGQGESKGEDEDGMGVGLGPEEDSDEDGDEEEDREPLRGPVAVERRVVHDPFAASGGSGSASGSSERDRFGDSIRGKQVLESSQMSAMSASGGISSGGREGGVMQQMVRHAKAIGAVAESVSGVGFDSQEDSSMSSTGAGRGGVRRPAMMMLDASAMGSGAISMEEQQAAGGLRLELGASSGGLAPSLAVGTDESSAGEEQQDGIVRLGGPQGGLLARRRKKQLRIGGDATAGGASTGMDPITMGQPAATPQRQASAGPLTSPPADASTVGASPKGSLRSRKPKGLSLGLGGGSGTAGGLSIAASGPDGSPAGASTTAGNGLEENPWATQGTGAGGDSGDDVAAIDRDDASRMKMVADISDRDKHIFAAVRAGGQEGQEGGLRDNGVVDVNELEVGPDGIVVSSLGRQILSEFQRESPSGGGGGAMGGGSSAFSQTSAGGRGAHKRRRSQTEPATDGISSQSLKAAQAEAALRLGGSEDDRKTQTMRGGGRAGLGSLHTKDRRVDALGGMRISESMAAAIAKAVQRVEKRSIKDDLVKLDHLGAGASGQVHLAVHTPSLRLVALKEVRLFDKEKRKQMAAELRTLFAQIAFLPTATGEGPVGAAVSDREWNDRRGVGGVGCPFIVRMHDAYSDPKENAMCMVLEFCGGGSLEDVVESGGVQHEPTLANYAWQVMQAMAFMHSQRQLHRDIKPANILLSGDGRECKVADFGIRRQLEDTLGEADTFVGTMVYMAPERIGKGGKYSYASDIWSVGLTLLTLAAGKFPYKDCGFWSLAGAIENDPAPLHVLEECLAERGLPTDGDGLSKDGLGFSAEFRDFIDQTLRKNPRERPSARRLLRHAFFRKHKLFAPEGMMAPARWVTEPRLPTTISSEKREARNRKARDKCRGAALKLTQPEGFESFLLHHMHAPLPPPGSKGRKEAAKRHEASGPSSLEGSMTADMLTRELVLTSFTGDFSRLRKNKRLVALIDRAAKLGVEEVEDVDGEAESSSSGKTKSGGEGGAGGKGQSNSVDAPLIRKVQSFTGGAFGGGASGGGGSSGTKAAAWALSEGASAADPASGGSGGGTLPPPAARRNSMATYSGAKTSGFQRKVVEIARQMKAAMEAEEEAESAGADVFSRRRERGAARSGPVEVVIDDREAGGGGSKAETSGPIPGEKQDPAVDELVSWRQVELQDRDVIGMAGQLGLPASKVSDTRAAMNAIIEQQVTEYIRKRDRRAGRAGRGGAAGGGGGRGGGGRSKGGLSRNQEKLRMKRGGTGRRERPGGLPSKPPPLAPDDAGLGASSGTGGSGGIAGSSSLRRRGAGGGSATSSQVQGMLPGRRYDSGGSGSTGGGRAAGSPSRGTLGGSVSTSVAVRKTGGGRFAMDMDIPQYRT